MRPKERYSRTCLRSLLKARGWWKQPGAGPFLSGQRYPALNWEPGCCAGGHGSGWSPCVSPGWLGPAGRASSSPHSLAPRRCGPGCQRWMAPGSRRPPGGSPWPRSGKQLMPRGAQRTPAHSPVKVIPRVRVVAPRLRGALLTGLCPRAQESAAAGGWWQRGKAGEILWKLGGSNENRRETIKFGISLRYSSK